MPSDRITPSIPDPRERPVPGVVVLLVLAGLAAVGGCGDTAGAGHTDWLTTVDTLESGAVRVRHTPPRDPASTWRFEPDLRIGRLDGHTPDVFGRIVDLDVASNGRIVVLDGQAQEVRVFGPDGAHLRTIGGKGSGPGQFQMASAVASGPDGLLRVADARNQRLALVDLEAGVVGSHPLTSLRSPQSGDFVVDSAGTSWSPHFIPREDGAEVAFVGHDPSGSALDTLHGWTLDRRPPMDHPGLWIESSGRGFRVIGPVPYYAPERHVVTSTVRVWSTVESDPSYRLVRWRPGTRDTSLIIEVDRPAVGVDRELVDSIVRHYESEAERRLDRSKVPERAPSVQDFFVDDDGRLWVHARTVHDDSLQTLDAFDSMDGAYLGTLVTPVPLRVATPFSRVGTPPPVIRDGRVWAVVLDQFDVPHVVRGRLEPVSTDAP